LQAQSHGLHPQLEMALRERSQMLDQPLARCRIVRGGAARAVDDVHDHLAAPQALDLDGEEFRLALSEFLQRDEARPEPPGAAMSAAGIPLQIRLQPLGEFGNVLAGEPEHQPDALLERWRSPFALLIGPLLRTPSAAIAPLAIAIGALARIRPLGAIPPLA